ncbi:MAG: PaREP1 family protein [Candidatus Methanospirareceae archaeon]
MWFTYYSDEARKKGRWTVTLLEKAVDELTPKIGEIVHRAWSDGYDLHVKGFHEHFLGKESVERYARSIKELFEKFKLLFFELVSSSADESLLYNKRL